jgi:phosphonate transport system substrate-binding protein
MNQYLKYIKPHLSWALLILMPAFPAQAQDVAPPGYSFGIGPQQSATELAKRWTPVMQYLSEKSGVSVQFKTAKDIPTFQQLMLEGAFDFAFINPYHYTIFSKKAGYLAFAQEHEGRLVGVLVVKKDSPIKDVRQLNGQTVAFPAANALAATWLPINFIKEQGASVTPQYVNSMDSVYRGVAKGLFPAGGGEARTLGTIDPEIRNQLEVLWTSEPLPPFVFAAHPRVPKDVVARVQKAMDEMDTQPQGIALLKTLNFKGMRKADDNDYAAMRKMNLKPVDAK